jgi:hypothetical protein
MSNIKKKIKKAEAKLAKLKAQQRNAILFSREEISEFRSLNEGTIVEVFYNVVIDGKSVNTDDLRVKVWWKADEESTSAVTSSSYDHGYEVEVLECKSVHDAMCEFDKRIRDFIVAFDKKHGKHNEDGQEKWDAIHEFL